MLLDREPYDSIAEALRIDQAEVSGRAQRIVGRLRPRRSVYLDDVFRGRAAYETR